LIYQQNMSLKMDLPAAVGCCFTLDFSLSKGLHMTQVTRKHLSEILIGIAKTQAAIIGALREPNDIKLLSSVQSRVGGLVGVGRTTKQPITFENLPAHLLLKALSTPGPQGQTIEQFADQEVGRLLGKTEAPS
jgi:hypothetical protein